MAERDRTAQREERAAGRQQRRGGQTRTPPEEPQQDDGGFDAESHDTVKQALKLAAAAATVGAAAGAVRALTNDGHESGNEGEDVAAVDDQASAAPEQHDEPEPEAETDLEEPHPEQAQPDGAPAATPAADVERVLDAARTQLKAILGRPADSVSGFERSEAGWLVQLEVVEVARIPASTDVLASYMLTLDGDRNLVRYRRGGRYYRSQASPEEAT
jgi:hypothetical protein